MGETCYRLAAEEWASARDLIVDDRRLAPRPIRVQAISEAFHVGRIRPQNGCSSTGVLMKLGKSQRYEHEGMFLRDNGPTLAFF